MQNIQKCLAAGFQFVLAIALEPKRLKVMTAAVAKELVEDASRVVVTSADGLFEVLGELESGTAPERQTVRGYAVNVRPAARRGVAPRPKSVAQTIVGAVQRLRSK